MVQTVNANPGTAHVYWPDGTWVGQIDLARLCALHARFEHTYLSNPRLFAKLDCRPEDFEKEVALLLQRWRKDTKGVGEKAILRNMAAYTPCCSPPCVTLWGSPQNSLPAP